MHNVSFVGNLVRDPELKVSASGTPRTIFTVAVNEGEKDSDHEKTHYLDVTAFGTLGENLAESLHKGQRVIVEGRFNQYKKEVQIGGEDKSITITSFRANAVGPDLRWAQAKVVKVSSDREEDRPAPAVKENADQPAAKTQPAEKTQPAVKAKPAAVDDDDF